MAKEVSGPRIGALKRLNGRPVVRVGGDLRQFGGSKIVLKSLGQLDELDSGSLLVLDTNRPPFRGSVEIEDGTKLGC